MKIDELTLPESAITLIQNRGITSLYPPQTKAVKKGLLEGENIVLAIPTASGKTLVAELAMLKTVLEKGGKALYLVPLKALASEKYAEFKEFEELGISVVQSTGDFDSDEFRLGKYDIIICTNERFDSLLRHEVNWIQEIGLIVADEVHLIDDSSRGPTLEVVLARLKNILPQAQLLALSATINNADEIADWLEAQLVKSSWRPVRLSEGVYWNKTIHFASQETIPIPQEHSRYPEIDLVFDTVKNDGQALVFANTRRSAQAAADRIAPAVSKLLSKNERKVLREASERILSAGEKTNLSERLARVIRKGSAFHHAGLNPTHRKIIEDYFKNNYIKCVSATPTLAAGVNLPARRVIILSLSRYQAGMGMQPIPVLEYKQQAGRAGRPKYDNVGEAIVVAKKRRDVQHYMTNYLLADTEMIWSKLASENALRSHILAAIAIGYVQDLKELAKFIQETFYGYQNEIATTEFQVKKILRFLVDEGMIETKEGRLWATKFGSRVSQLYIDPLSAVIIRDGLRIANASDLSPNSLAIFQLIASTPDIRNLYIRKKDTSKLQRVLDEKEEFFLVDIPESWDPDYEYFLMGLKTALLLRDWINELPENKLLQKYNVGSGDILYITDNAKWLLYAAHAIAKLFNFKAIQSPLNELHLRVANGIKKELVPLVKIKGIGRVRARILYNNGYKSLRSLRSAPHRELAALPTLGPEIVRSIKEQIGDKIPDKSLEKTFE
ncbi:MAG: ATP-dependent DNA helicase [Asgard group archaeon]|nr:ATP-dependent DNA helicase [Asgard group archaeon]